ncbi:MAG: FAD-binding oxidoreductase, partial [Betaproteobacteria bacterium]|nr:FAD-binding oxidoreductase [Betaproteobacteria bacterium]
MSAAREADVVVVGGGIVGASVAYGLARKGRSVVLLDEGDDAFRAARGNFGLVWVQGKGAGAPHYARWTMRSAAGWPALARDLADETGIDVQLTQPGGFHLCLNEGELAERRSILTGLRAALDGDYPFELLDHAAT